MTNKVEKKTQILYKEQQEDKVLNTQQEQHNDGSHSNQQVGLLMDVDVSLKKVDG